MKTYLLAALLGLVSVGCLTVACVRTAQADAGPMDAGPTMTDAGPAATPTVTDPGKDGGKFLEEMLQAAKTSNWKLLAVGLVVLFTFVLRRFGGKLLPWLATDVGGVVSAFLVAAGGWVANLLAAGAKPSWASIIDILMMALAAMGAWAAAKKTANVLTSKKPGAELLEPDES